MYINSIVEKYLNEAKTDKKRASWMKSYEDLLKNRPDHKHGKVDWDTANYLYNSGESPESAVSKMKNSNPYR